MAAPEGSKSNPLKAVIGTLLIIAAILLVFGFFAARTEGFKNYLQDQIQKRTGQRFDIGDTRIGWPYDLVLQDVKYRDPHADAKGTLTMKEVRVGISLDLTWRIGVTGADLTLVESTEGQWTPALLAALGPIKRMGEVSEITSDLQTQVLLDVEDSTIQWINRKGERTGTAKGLGFVMTLLHPPNRTLCYFRLTAREVVRANDGRIHDVDREWVCTVSKPYIEIESRADWGRDPDAGDLWSRQTESHTEGRKGAD